MTLAIGDTVVALHSYTASELAAPRREAEREATERLVRLLAGEGAAIVHDAEGAPRLVGADGHVSVSHCATMAAVALRPSGSVGIDVEGPRHDQLRRVAPRFLNADELQLFGDDPDLLLRAWTAKEAVYKCALTPGLALADIDCSALPPASSPAGRFNVTHQQLDGALLALAVPLI